MKKLIALWALVAFLLLSSAFFVGAQWQYDRTDPRDLLPACEYEDGRTDGQPCVWTDPTGARYIVDSSEYRR